MLKKVFAVTLVATAIAGCTSEYDYDNVTVKSGQKGWPSAVYVDKKDQEPLTGTIVGRTGEVETIRFTVEDGVVNGPFIKRASKGPLQAELNILKGKQSGEQKTYCVDGVQLADLMVVGDAKIARTKYDCATGQVLEEETWLNAEYGHTNVGEHLKWKLLADGKRVPESIENFSAAGKMDGVSESYFDNGKLKTRTHYKDGYKDGTEETWTEFNDGTFQLTTKSEYAKGIAVEEVSYKTDEPWPEGSIDSRRFSKQGQDGVSTTFFSVNYGDDAASLTFYGDYFRMSAAEANVFNKLMQNGAPTEAHFGEIDYLIKNTDVNLNEMRTNRGEPLIMVSNPVNRDKLISLGVDINAKDQTGRSLLGKCTTKDSIFSPQRCSLALISKLITEEAPSTDLFGNTPLISFCRTLEQYAESDPAETKAVFKELLAKSDVNAVNLRGRTALHECLRTDGISNNKQRDLSYAQLLVDAGADLSKKDISGLIPAQMLFVDSYSTNGSLYIHSNEAIIKAALEFGKGSIDLKAPFPVFDKPLKQLFLEDGNAGSAMMIEQFGG
jgi:antitoxin component YwqK of YwqJK toxin-antitoxin module